MTQATKELEFLKALSAFHLAANNLLAKWNDADHTGDYFNADYPFESDFETVVRNIGQWKDTQNNVGFSGEAIKPQPEKTESHFHNSILEEDRKKFPHEIEVSTDRGNNPLGRFELSVIANGELLGTYYYEIESEQSDDCYALEYYFEVTVN